jgi:hypothetical protein
MRILREGGGPWFSCGGSSPHRSALRAR